MYVGLFYLSFVPNIQRARLTLNDATFFSLVPIARSVQDNFFYNVYKSNRPQSLGVINHRCEIDTERCLYNVVHGTSNHEVSQFENCHDISWSVAYKDHKKLKKKHDKIKDQGTTSIPNLSVSRYTWYLFTYYSYYFQVHIYIGR